MPLRKIQLSGLVLLVLVVAAVGFEYRTNRLGPQPLPDAASQSAGRELLSQVLAAHAAESWAGRDTVLARITYQVIGRPPRVLRMMLEPASRSAEFRDPVAPNTTYHLDGRDETIAPAEARLSGVLERLGPSAVWWIMMPANLDDPAAILWRLPDRRSGYGTVPRLAVRWSGEIEWFIFEIDPADSTIRSVEFIDERLSPIFRWRGVGQGRTVVNGLTWTSSWRFSAANPVLRLLTGNRNLIVLNFEPVV